MSKINEKNKKFIDNLRKEFGIKANPESPEEYARRKKEEEARHKRMEAAGTEDNYVKMFQRDPYTDEWLGDGPEPPMPFLEDELEEEEQQTAMDERKAREAEEKEKLYAMRRPILHIKPALSKKEAKQVKKEAEKLQKMSKKKRKKLERIRNAKDAERHNADHMWQEKCDWTYWLLFEFLKRKFACELVENWIDRKLTFDEMVQEGYDKAMYFVHSTNCVTDHRVPEKKAFKLLVKQKKQAKYDRKHGIFEAHGLKWQSLPDLEGWSQVAAYPCDPLDGEEHEVPAVHKVAWKKWKKDHPVKEFEKKARKLGVMAADLRICTFIKMMNKKTRKTRRAIIETSKNDGTFCGSLVTETMCLDKKEYKKEKKREDKKIRKFRKWREKLDEAMLIAGYENLDKWYEWEEAVGCDARQNDSKQVAQFRKTLKRKFKWLQQQAATTEGRRRAEKTIQEWHDWNDKQTDRERMLIERKRKHWMKVNGVKDASNVPFKITREPDKKGRLKAEIDKPGVSLDDLERLACR